MTLDFDIYSGSTIVKSTLSVVKNEGSTVEKGDLILDGDDSSVKVRGRIHVTFYVIIYIIYRKTSI